MLSVAMVFYCLFMPNFLYKFLRN